VTAPEWQPTATLAALRLRAALLERVRAHFAATGALEVDTPILVRAAVTDVHLESLAVREAAGRTAGYLQTSPEYAMKRLLCSGAPDIYQIAHVFREGERGRRHNPEFTMIEWYRHGIDHHALMDEVERLLHALLAPHVALGPAVRVPYVEAFRDALGVDPLGCSAGELRRAIADHGGSIPASLAADDLDDLIDLATGTLVTARFPADRITLLYDFPAGQAALARVRGPLASRFEAFFGPLELANGFHELADPQEQRARFAADLEARQRRGRPAHAPDERLLAALASGLPACSGVALGFDRVVMIAAGASSIDEVLAFAYERA